MRRTGSCPKRSASRRLSHASPVRATCASGQPARRREVDRCGAGRAARRDARRRRQARRARFVEPVEQGEGNVGGFTASVSAAQVAARPRRSAPRAPRLARSRSVRRRRSPITFSVVSATGVNTPPMPPRLVADGAVGEGEVALLGVAVALEQEQQIVGAGRIARCASRRRASGR